jgi:hypothetical protein
VDALAFGEVRVDGGVVVAGETERVAGATPPDPWSMDSDRTGRQVAHSYWAWALLLVCELIISW